MKQELNFELTTMNGADAYIAEPYKVVRLDYTEVNGYLKRKPHWAGYYRIKDPSTKRMLFGDSVEHPNNFKTKERAFKACQKHVTRIRMTKSLIW